MSLPDYLATHVGEETLYHVVKGRFVLESGEWLKDVQIAYRTWGDPANAQDHAILICHALTGSADVDAWWPNIIGAGRAFNPENDFVICANILGGCYGTTGPVSLKPGTADRYRADFPRISIRDMVNLECKLLDQLGVDKLELVTGPSLGGMRALEWALMYPERVTAIAPIGVGARHSAWCIGISEAQRAAIEADPNWNDGNYSDLARPEKGMAAARMMAVCTYRSWQSFDSRFGRELAADGSYFVQTYLRHQAARMNERFDANTYVTLTHAMHTHDISRGRGALVEAIAAIDQPALVVSVSSDALYPPQEQEYLATHMPDARYEILDSVHGHDGFLIQTTALGEMISDFRASLGRSVSLRLLSSGRERRHS